MPDTTSVLLYKNKPVGFCFMNITDTKANIPIVGIKKEHQGKGLAKYLLQNSMDKIIKKYPITEVNTCTDTENISALKMYKNAGFKEDYTYIQSYLPLSLH